MGEDGLMGRVGCRDVKTAPRHTRDASHLSARVPRDLRPGRGQRRRPLLRQVRGRVCAAACAVRLASILGNRLSERVPSTRARLFVWSAYHMSSRDPGAGEEGRPQRAGAPETARLAVAGGQSRWQGRPDRLLRHGGRRTHAHTHPIT